MKDMSIILLTFMINSTDIQSEKKSFKVIQRRGSNPIHAIK